MAVRGADEATPAAALTRKLTILDLPQEVQKDIVAQCAQSDLICLSLVSAHFRELAAAQLYRNFHIVFPDEDDPAYDSPIDGLAGGLDTFVTSDYDYAKHLRDLSLDTLSAGDKAEAAYKHYLFSVSCGKFMNTLLLLTLKKARVLETFKWNIRVELSRPVYKALHNIETLKDVHIRLQVGPSLFETPPPLPYTASSLNLTPSASSSHLPDVGPPPPPPPMSLFGITPVPSITYGNSLVTSMVSGPPPPLKPSLRTRAKKPPMSKEPPTLSGFKKLRSLAVLDMDTLDAVTEIKACIRNSASTLTKLKLSFSDHLAMQSRKPPPEAEMDDSDQDDEFQVVPVQPHPAPYSDSSMSMPARAFRAAEERKSQDAVLGRIFDVEPYVVKKPSKSVAPKEKEASHSQAAKEDDEDAATPAPAKEFINAIKKLSNKLMRDLSRPRDYDSDLTAAQQEVLDVIETAARKYVASDEAKAKLPQNSTSNGESGSGSTAASASDQTEGVSGPNCDGTAAAVDPSAIAAETQAAAGDDPQDPAPPESGSARPAKPVADGSPEAIDIEEPEEQLTLDGQETPGLSAEAETPSSRSATPKSSSASASKPVDSPSLDKAMANLAAQKVNFATLIAKLESHEQRADKLSKEVQDMDDTDRLAEAGRQMQDLGKNIVEMQQEMRTVEAEMADAEKQTLLAMAAGEDDATAQNRRISDYIRATRGLSLESLSVYLVPVRPSVLSRAIDLRVLRRITLLNVGAQGPIWALFAKENKQQPLPLRKIFTDNVTPSFLTFVSQLEELHELFILERDHRKYKPESFAGKTTATNEQIRRLILRRHLPTLKRLMIKNMDTTDWDVDEQTTRLICRRGKNLEELAVSMNIRAVHVLMQSIAGLAQLHALHIIQLRNEDTCVWVMRETKRFLVDTLSHHPEMKLEWISIDDDDRLEKIIRITDEPRTSKRALAKGKGKAVSSNGAASGSEYDDAFPILTAPDSWDAVAGGGGGAGASDDDSDDLYDDYEPGRPRVKLETLEGVHFYDVWGVRIFKKEVITGRL